MQKDSKILLKELHNIIKNHKNLTDLELSVQIFNLYDKYPNINITSYKLNKIIEERVKIYCMNNNIKLNEYFGVLPYKKIKRNVL